MRTSTARCMGAIAIGVALAGSLLCSAQSNGSSKRILGYKDANSGEFHALPKAIPDTTATPVTGTVELTLNITVKSTFPAGTTRVINCQNALSYVAVNTSDATLEYTEEASSNATGSGTSYTCTTTIPYSWVPPTGTVLEGQVSGSYTISVTNTTTSAGPPVLRISGSTYFTAATPPASGTVTKVTVNATI